MREWIAVVALAAAALDVPPVRAATPVASVEILDRVRALTAELLGRKKSAVEIARPLSEQGMDELDLVELVMALEEEFSIELPDSEVAPKGKESFTTLTVQQLAEIVGVQLRKKG